MTETQEVDPGLRAMLEKTLGDQIGGDTDAYEVFNWDPDPSIEKYYATYIRNPYARAIVDTPVNTGWRDPPDIVDTDETDNTQFEQDIEDLEENKRLWHYCQRADLLSGIGEYGALVLEFDDVSGAGDYSKPVSGANELTGLRPFSQLSISNIAVGGPGSGRWGKPISYTFDLSDEDDATTSQKGPDELDVHHSRVIHIPSDGLLDDEIRGSPRQEAVFNNLTDIEKSLGSAAELAYRASAWGLAINISGDYQIEDDSEDLREHLDRWYHGIEPILRTQGADDVKSLGGESIDPTPIISANIEAMSAHTGIPQSVLKGNETGERATTQDLKDWYGTVQGRREQFQTPIIVKAVIDTLLEFGVIAPHQGRSYEVEWPALAEVSELEMSEIHHNRARAVQAMKSAIPGYGGEEWREYLDGGDFPEVPDDVSDVEPADEEMLEQFRQETQPTQPMVPDGGGDE